MSIPQKDSSLVGYVSNWKTRITASPSDWNLQASDVTAISDAVTPYVTAYNTLIQAYEAKIRSSDLARNKDDARSAMLAVIRQYYKTIQANSSVTDGNKELLGITIRKQPSPTPTPAEQPIIDIKKVVGYTVFMHVHGTDENRKGLPVGVQGIMVYSLVGSTPSPDVNDWSLQGIITRANLEIELPPSTTPGAQVWFRAAYYNRRGQVGPASAAVSTHLQFQSSSLLNAA